jgi:hypothetical protein
VAFSPWPFSWTFSRSPEAEAVGSISRTEVLVAGSHGLGEGHSASGVAAGGGDGGIVVIVDVVEESKTELSS